MPSIGSCAMPSTVSGSGMPAASRIVGPTSITCVNCERITSSGLDPRRPRDHHRVARAAQVARRLLAPLERRVAGVRPRRGDVRRRVVAAERLEATVLLDQLGLLRGIQDQPVEERQLVERARDGALEAGAVVAPDEDDQRVVEVAHRLDLIQQPADVPVGVLLVAGVDLHLPRVQLLRRVVERIPRGERVGPGRSARCPAGRSRAASAARASASRSASHPSSNLPLYLSAHSFGTWCGACAQPVE